MDLRNDYNMKNRSTTSMLNATASIVSQVIVILLNFVARTIFIKCLSTEYLGINGLCTNILTVLSFAELGIGEAMVFAMYKPYREKDEDKLCQLMGLYRNAYYLIALIVFAIGILVSFFLDVIVKEEPSIPENFHVIFLIYLINTAVSYLFTYKKSILLVAQKRYIVVIFQLVCSVIQLLAQASILLLLHDYILYLICQVGCTLGGNIAISIYVNKKYPFINEERGKLRKEERKSIFSNVKALAVTKMAGIVGSGTDNIIASNMIGLTIVGLSSNYSLIINAANGLLWAFLNGITNSIGDFNVDSTIERRRDIFDELYLCSYWIFAFSGVCIIALINPLIELWIGDSYILSGWVAFWLVFSIFLGGLNYPAYSYRISLGFFKQVQIFYVSYAILNIVLSILSAKIWGIIGIFAATPISRLVTAEIADGYYVFKYGLRLNPFRYFIRDIYCILFFSVNSILCCKLINLISMGGLVGFIVKTVICIMISNAIILVSVFWMPAFPRVIERGKIFIQKVANI